MAENIAKNQLAELSGGFSVMPNALIGFISDKACTLFLKIYQCQFMLEKMELDGEGWVQISGPFLTAALRKVNRNSINNAINELVGLNLIRSKTVSRKQVLYKINWGEIKFACNILCSVNFDGRNKLQDICVRDNFVPISKLDADIRDEIVRNHPRKQDSYQNCTNQDGFVSKLYEQQDSYPNRTNDDGFVSKLIRTENDSYQNRTNEFEIRNEIDTNQNSVRIKNVQTEEDSYQNCTNVEDDDESYDSYMDISDMEQDSKHVRNEIDTNNQEIRNEIDTNDDEIRIQIVHNIYNRKNKNKKLVERSSQKEINKEKENNEEIENFILKSFKERDSSLPVLDKYLVDYLLENEISENDDDVVKSIKVVWSQLQYDEEVSDNNFIDINTFQNILYHSWSQLKEDYEDYSLSETDIKNIFGFILMEHDGEQCLYIDPTKFRDITHSQPVRKKHAKEYKFSDRTSRRLFLECIDEIGNKDIDLLTSSEYLVILLMDYASEHRRGAFSAELTRSGYKSLTEDLSGQCRLSNEVVEGLLSDLPHKGHVKINPQLLIPDKFFEFNRQNGEDSKVEKLFLEKLKKEEANADKDLEI